MTQRNSRPDLPGDALDDLTPAEAEEARELLRRKEELECEIDAD
jgi:hypothetical protein